MPRCKMLPATEWALDYETFTPPELRQLIHDRISATLTAKERRTIQNCNRYQLINRLRKSDQEGSFPRFMELPAELRVSVYEFLLVHPTGDDEDGASKGIIHHDENSSTIHPAVLRTSKLIYAEAKPILYKKNKFSACIRHRRTGGFCRPRRAHGCNLVIMGAGRRRIHDQNMSQTPFLRHLFEDSGAMNILRSLTHFTIDLNLFPRLAVGRAEYVFLASNAIASLCLALTGASKMEELTSNLRADYQKLDSVEPASILWPLVLLRTSIAVKFEGIAPSPGKSVSHRDTSQRAQESHGGQIADVRRLCNEEIERHGWDAEGLREVESALDELSHFGWSLLLLEDIVNQSAFWKGIRSEADRMEAVWAKQFGGMCSVWCEG